MAAKNQVGGKVGPNLIDLEGFYICKIHNKPYEFFCKDENKLACSKCAVFTHRKCKNVIDIENVVEQMDTEDVVTKLMSGIRKSRQAIENLQEAKVCLQEDDQQFVDKLKEMKAQIVQLIDDLTERVTKHMRTTSGKLLADWDESLQKCEANIDTLESTLNSIDGITTDGSAVQNFILNHQMKGKVDELTVNTTKVSETLMTLDIECDFGQHFYEFKSRLLSIIKPENFAIKYSVQKPVELEHIATMDLKQSGDDVGEPLYSGLDFLPDGRLVAVDNKNGKCLLYDVNLNLKSSFKLPCDYTQCVAVVSDDEVVVTTGGRYELYLLHISKSNEISLTKTHDVCVSYYSISRRDEETCVVSTIKHDKPFRIVSLSGEEKDFDTKLPAKQYDICKSFCTYTRGKNKVVHFDRDGDTIFICNTETGERITIKDKLIKRTCGVAVGPYDRVFICSQDTRSLIEMSPEGRLISSHQLEMNYPRSIAVSKYRKSIAVSNAAAGAKKLSIYKII